MENLGAIDILIFKGEQELEETLKMWKQKTHVMRYFKNDAHEQPKQLGIETSFLQRFLSEK